MDDHQDVISKVHAEVAKSLGAGDAPRDEERSRADGEKRAKELITDALARRAREAITSGNQPLSPEEEDRIKRAVLDAIFGLGPLQPYLDDDTVTDIHAQGCDHVFVVYEDGRKERVGPIAASDDKLKRLLQTVASRKGRTERRFDAAHPELNLRLGDGSRLFAVMGVSGRVSLAIRRHRFPRVFLTDLIKLGTVDEPLAAFLSAAVRARKNILVAGGTGVGKTTMLRAVLNEVPPEERIITIEDSLELGLDRFEDLHPDVVTLEERQPNVEGEGAVPLERLVRMALRMDPDRVIVGEVRGDEVLPMLNAMSQGNDGSMCTLHAHSSESAFRKLAQYAMQTPQRLPIEATNLLVANAVDFVVHMAMDHHENGRGCRYVTSIREVVDADGPLVVSNEVFRPGPQRRAVPGAPLRSQTLDDLVTAGLEPGLLRKEVASW